MSSPQHTCAMCPSQNKSVFCEMNHEELHELSGHKIENNYKRGQNIFLEGQPYFGIYCVLSGTVKITKTDISGKECILYLASRGDILGYRGLLTDKLCDTNAVAMEDSRMCFFDKKYIIHLIKKNPKFALKIISYLGEALVFSDRKLSSFHQKNVLERLAETLLLIKRSHGKIDKANGGVLLDLKLSREDLASMVGTATETIIRFMSELKDEGFIKQVGKKIYIMDEKGLLNLANIHS